MDVDVPIQINTQFIMRNIFIAPRRGHNPAIKWWHRQVLTNSAPIPV